MKLGMEEDIALEHRLYTFMKDFTAGHVKEFIQHGVPNGVDAWRKLYRYQLPLADDKSDILMTEFMTLTELLNASGLRHIMPERERIPDSWERLANRPFDEEAKVGTFRELIPTNA